eukprot:4959803-Amphidinium_carterae.1
MEWPDGRQYIGLWQNNKPEGHGRADMRVGTELGDCDTGTRAVWKGRWSGGRPLMLERVPDTLPSKHHDPATVLESTF